LSDAEDISDDGDGVGLCSGSYVASVRPGIVHWLDKGTSGLLVFAKGTPPPPLLITLVVLMLNLLSKFMK
jgi:hypothetical protein